MTREEELDVSVRIGAMTTEEAQRIRRLWALADRVCNCGRAPKSERFYWPGSEPRECCGLCAALAAKIAEVMGFELRVESTLTGNEPFEGSRTRLLEIDR